MLHANFEGAVQTFIGQIQQLLPSEQYQKTIDCLLLEIKRIMVLKEKGFDNVTAADVEKLVGLKKIINKHLIELVAFLLKLDKKTRTKTDSIILFLCTEDSISTKFISDCNLLTNIPKQQFAPWNIEQGKFYKKVLKMLTADPHFKPFKKTKGRIALIAAGCFQSLSEMALGIDDLDLAMYASSSGIDCMHYVDVNEDDNENKLVFSNQFLLKPKILSGKGVKSHIISTSNLTYYYRYRAKGLVNESHGFLIKAINASFYFDLKLIGAALIYIYGT